MANWGETDGLSVYLLAPILARAPGRIAELPPWTASRNRWRRRAAAVALTPLARRYACEKLPAGLRSRVLGRRGR